MEEEISYTVNPNVPSVVSNGMKDSTIDPARSCKVVAPDTALDDMFPIACNTLTFCSVSVSLPSDPVIQV